MGVFLTFVWYHLFDSRNHIQPKPSPKVTFQPGFQSRSSTLGVGACLYQIAHEELASLHNGWFMLSTFVCRCFPSTAVTWHRFIILHQDVMLGTCDFFFLKRERCDQLVHGNQASPSHQPVNRWCDERGEKKLAMSWLLLSICPSGLTKTYLLHDNWMYLSQIRKGTRKLYAIDLCSYQMLKYHGLVLNSVVSLRDWAGPLVPKYHP